MLYCGQYDTVCQVETARRCRNDARHVLDIGLLEWVSEYAVRADNTPDSAVSYLNHAMIA